VVRADLAKVWIPAFAGMTERLALTPLSNGSLTTSF
jgi:hypothetical protein